MQEACKKTGKQKFTVIQHRDKVKKTKDINEFYGYLQFQFNDSEKKRLLLRGYGEIPIKINPIGEQDAKWQYC